MDNLRNDDRSIITIDDLILRVRIPEENSNHPITLMLHGWTGNENVMWIFASRLPKNHILVAPRGLFPTVNGGYGWYPVKSRIWPWVDDFIPAIERLNTLLTSENFPKADFSRLSLVGFSQGAALAYAFTLLNPDKVSAVAGLSGFLPDGVQAYSREEGLRGLQVFVTHGTEDELVPVARARESVAFFEQNFAQVTYCEDQVGHKLSAGCFRGLEYFFAGLECSWCFP
jgi:phospholipase/carboxylesterase